MKKAIGLFIVVCFFVCGGSSHRERVPSLAEKIEEFLEGDPVFKQFLNNYYLSPEFIDLISERYRVLGMRTNLMVFINSRITETEIRRLVQFITTTIVIPPPAGGMTQIDPPTRNMEYEGNGDYDNNDNGNNEVPIQLPPTIITQTTQRVITIRVVTVSNETRKITILVGNDGTVGGNSSNSLNFQINFNGTPLTAAQFRQVLNTLITANFSIQMNKK